MTCSPTTGDFIFTDQWRDKLTGRDAWEQIVTGGSSFSAEARLIGYASGNFGKNLLWSTADVTLLFMLTDLIGLRPSTAGLLLLLAIVGDVAVDIGIGGAIARARGKHAGYRNFMMIGTPICALSFAFLFSLPERGIRDVVTIAFWLLLFRAGYALVDVPHNALLGRAASDSRSRSRGSGYRYFFSSLATLVVATILTPLVTAEAHSTASNALMVFGTIAAAALALSIGVVWLSIGVSKPGTVQAGVVANWLDAVTPPGDRQFLIIAVIGALTGFALPMFSRMMIYYCKYVMEQPASASSLLTALVAGQFIGVGIWSALARWLENATMLSASYGLTALALSVFVLARGSAALWAQCITVFAGIGLAGVFMLPWAMLADTVDLSHFLSGQRREPAAFATFLVLLKLGGALSAALVGWSLAVAGYRPDLRQPESVKSWITFLACAIPILAALVCTSLIRGTWLTRYRHGEIVKQLTHRERLISIENATTPDRSLDLHTPCASDSRSAR